MESKAPSPDQLTAREHEILKRMSSGLSDQQIGADLFLSLHTVKWYNRQIYSKLAVGSRTQAVAHAKRLGLLDDPVSPLPAPVTGHNLPAPTSAFIGRLREVGEVKQLLGNSRLLTLTGTGGTGKTRLALRMAAEISADFADGVCFVDLAPLTDDALIANAIAEGLGVVENSTEPVLTTLKRVLAPREMLLVLDNFEHLVHAAPLISELLAAAPQLKVLATSRAVLRLSGEQEYPVPPLSLPATDKDSIRAVTDSEAGLLFVQRAQMGQPQFALSPDNAPAVPQNQVEVMLTQSHRALDYLHPDNLPVRTGALWTLGYAYQIQGDRAAAKQAYSEAQSISQASGNVMITLAVATCLGKIQEADNQLALATENYQHVLHLFGEPPPPYT